MSEAEHLGNGWTWLESPVDIQQEHMELSYVKHPGVFPRQSIPVALVAPGGEKSFHVQFLLTPEKEYPETVEALSWARSELDFYLTQHVGPSRFKRTHPVSREREYSPWLYAIHHATLASANLYSPIHWAYFPKGREAGEHSLISILQIPEPQQDDGTKAPEQGQL